MLRYTLFGVTVRSHHDEQYKAVRKFSMAGSVVVWVTGDEGSRALIQSAAKQCRPDVGLVFIAGGEDLISYLHRSDTYAAPDRVVMPHLIFVDLSCVASDLVRSIKDDPQFRRIPLVAYASTAGGDLLDEAYASGANALVPHSGSFDDLCQVLSAAFDFWFDVARLPGRVFVPRSTVAAQPRLSTFRYRIHPAHKLGVARLRGPITGADLLESVETFLNAPALLDGYRILADYTAVLTVDIDPSEARDIARALFGYRGRLESGQTAVVVADKHHYLIGELLISAGRLDRTRVRIFNSLPDALAWLDVPETLATLD